MSYKAQKRKHGAYASRIYETTRDDSELVDGQAEKSDPSLYIQAYEADIVRGTQALAIAHSLEVERDSNGRTTRVGSALIRLGSIAVEPQDHHQTSDECRETWVDRYDARLLLDVQPIVATGPTSTERYSPTGWSDLPSDSEDTFFFDPDETEEYRREKRRKLIDQSREDRLRALRAEDALEIPQEDVWGGSDEEPDDAQTDLMRRTASHVVSSPNPAQLEMRILANHGGDSRFAFLRGRWSRAWKTMKGRVRLEKDQENVTTQKGLGGMGGLSGYGESDDESTHDVQEEGTVSVPLQIIEPEPKAMAPDDAIKEARRARAKEWAERRRTRQSENADHSG